MKIAELLSFPENCPIHLEYNKSELDKLFANIYISH